MNAYLDLSLQCTVLNDYHYEYCWVPMQLHPDLEQLFDQPSMLQLPAKGLITRLAR
jgi:hypothetical protein